MYAACILCIQHSTSCSLRRKPFKWLKQAAYRHCADGQSHPRPFHPWILISYVKGIPETTIFTSSSLSLLALDDDVNLHNHADRLRGKLTGTGAHKQRLNHIFLQNMGNQIRGKDCRETWGTCRTSKIRRAESPGMGTDASLKAANTSVSSFR